MGAIGRFLVATAAGAGLGAGAAFARRRHLATRAALPLPPIPWEATPGSAAAAAGAPPAALDAAPVTDPTAIADLEAARARLRQRAAELRAEMEGSPSHG